ncbi:MAG: tetratricopeptide repeat protein, partial [Chitinivibrionales bacterium]
LRQIGQPEAAIAQYEKAIEINPNLAETYNNLGITLARMGKTVEAIAQYKKSLEINPNKINALNNLAGAYVQVKQFKDAIPLLQKALALAKAAGDESQARGIATNLEMIKQSADSVQQDSR